MAIEHASVVLSGLSSAAIGKALRTWTSRSIYRATPKVRAEMMRAAQLLSKVPGQKFPPTAYRLLEIDVSKLKTWSNLYSHLQGKYPESYSGSLAGLKSFERNASGGHHQLDVSGFIVLEVDVPEASWLFSVRNLCSVLPANEQTIEDAAGFSLKEYLSQNECVARAGTLKACLKAGRVRLIGAAAPRKDITWYGKPKAIQLNIA